MTISSSRKTWATDLRNSWYMSVKLALSCLTTNTSWSKDSVPLNEVTHQAVQCDGMPAYFFKRLAFNWCWETLTSSELLQQFWCEAMLHDHMFMLLLTAHMHYVVSTSSTTQTINIYAVDNTLISSIINDMQIQPRLMPTASKPSQSLNKLIVAQYAQHLFSKVHCCKCGGRVA